MADTFGRLLIVDDEAAVLEVLSEYFTAQGHHVDTAVDGRAALDALARVHPDLVLLDIRMPGMDGVQVLREMRARASTVPVIMVTANEDVALAQLTLKLGAFDYVSKPFDFTYLDRTVTAGLLHNLASPEPAKDGADDPWRTLAVTVFRTARTIPTPARASLGERLEAAALRAAGEAAAGTTDAALRALGDVTLLAWLAVELGDLGVPEREAIDAAVAAVRETLGEA